MNAQEMRCGTPDLTPHEKSEMIRKLCGNDGSRSMGCTDPTWSGGDQTYRLILEYCPTFHELSQIELLAQQLNTFYSQYGITFETTIKKSECLDCNDPYDAGWGFNVDSESPYTDCLYGRITNSGANGFSGMGQIGNGRFWSTYNYVILNPSASWFYIPSHELGHSLGLIHTFDNFSVNNTLNQNEKIRETSSCPCNCLEKADLICDTPSTPYLLPNANGWNDKMFEYPIIKNSDGILDACGTNYTEINTLASVVKSMYDNNMSYFNKEPQFFTTGQSTRIKQLNQTSPWKTTYSTGFIACPAQPINTPTTFSSNKYFTDDLIINSELTVNNCTILFAPGKKIILNSKGSLKLDNSKLSKHLVGPCLLNQPQSPEWEGIKIMGNNVRIELKNNSLIEDVSEIGISSNGFNAIIDIKSGSHIFVPNETTIFKKSIEIIGGTVGVFTSNTKITGNVEFIDVRGGLNSKNTEWINNITITNSNIESNNNTIFRGDINVFNINLKNVRLSKSFFYKSVNISGGSGPTVVKGNKFYLNSESGGSGLSLTNVSLFDIYDNDFYQLPSPIKISGTMSSNANLIFKNRFHQCANGVEINKPNSKIAIECNTFDIATNRNFKIGDNGSMGDRQGDLETAAGNLFSRTAREVSFEGQLKVDYHYRSLNTEEPINIYDQGQPTFRKVLIPVSKASKCSFAYPNHEYLLTCYNGVLDPGETSVDCGGPCKPCSIISDPSNTTYIACNDGIQNNGETGIDCGSQCGPCHKCNDGIQNGTETGVDCGGPFCVPCNTPTCNDGILNNGETSIDCGGPCPACLGPTSSCNDGIQNNGETGTDCGGLCVPCLNSSGTTCYDGIQNGQETGIDCGGPCGPCGTLDVFTCYDGLQNNGETGIDCGGPCHPCITDGPPPPAPNQNFGPFVTSLNSIYGSSMIPLSSHVAIATNISTLNAAYDNGNTPNLLAFVENNSGTQPVNVINALISASPNVSPQVIHTLFKHSNNYTAAQVAQVLRLNPSLQYDPYVRHIVYSSTSFNSSINNVIVNAFLTADTRSSEVTNIDIKRLYSTVLLKDNISKALEYDFPDYGYIRSQLIRKYDPSCTYEIYDSYITEEKYRDASNYLAQINQTNVTDPYLKSQLIQFKIVHNILMKYYYAGNRLITMPIGEKNQLITIANGCYGEATEKSRMALTNLFQMTWSPIDCVMYSNLSFATNQLRPASARQTAVLSPNPATNEISVLILDFDYKIKYNIDIYDLQGKRILQQNLNQERHMIDISKWQAGIFTVKITNTIGKSIVEKFVKIN